jgi:hypothetical protein
MNFYFFYHYASDLSLVAAQWLDRVLLVLLFAIIRPHVLLQRPGPFHTLNELIPFSKKLKNTSCQLQNNSRRLQPNSLILYYEK